MHTNKIYFLFFFESKTRKLEANNNSPDSYPHQARPWPAALPFRSAPTLSSGFWVNILSRARDWVFWFPYHVTITSPLEKSKLPPVTLRLSNRNSEHMLNFHKCETENTEHMIILIRYFLTRNYTLV